MRLPRKVALEMRANVERGASRLDQRRPNWYKQIEAKSLDLSSSCDCVLGQLYGDYNKHTVARVVGGWVRKLPGLDKIGAKYGFVTPSSADRWAFHSDDPTAYRGIWEKLDTLWIEQIRARKRRDKEAAAA